MLLANGLEPIQLQFDGTADVTSPDVISAIAAAATFGASRTGILKLGDRLP